MQIGLDEIRELRLRDRRKLRRRAGIVVLLGVLLFLTMLCMRTTRPGMISPVEAASNLYTMVRLWLAKIFHWSIYSDRAAIIRAHSYYYETVSMFQGSILVMAIGATLAMAGCVCQAVLRNPIATPSMLGVSSSVRIVNLVLVLMYSTDIYTMARLQYYLSYAVSLVSLGLIFLVSRLMGRKKSSVTDMLLVGTIIVRMVQNFVQVYQYYYMTEEDYLILERINTYGTRSFESEIITVMYSLLFICALILFLLRFSMNAISFDDDDSRTLGIKAGRLRMIALAVAMLMVTVAQVNYGDIGMLSLLIPHLCRYWFGADFRNILVGCAGVGAFALLVCSLIEHFLSFNYYLNLIAIGTIINLVTTVLLILVLLQQRRGWT